jgi:cysteinyl-tRNA synthetase
VTPSTIGDAERALERLDNLARRFELEALAGAKLEVATDFDWNESARALYDQVGEFLDNDLDTPSAVAVLFEALSAANTSLDQGKIEYARDVARAVNVLFAALGLTLDGSSHEVDEASAELVTKRDQARNSKNWSEADHLRDELVALGWVVEDSSEGTSIRKP